MWSLGDIERARGLSKHQQYSSKMSKAEKDKLDMLDQSDKASEAAMLSKLRTGIDTMALEGKEAQFFMEEVHLYFVSACV